MIDGNDLGLMKQLVCLVEEQSVTQAANRLGLTQPALSRGLARLRHLMNDPVLIREGSRLKPTARALLAAEHAQATLRMASSVFRPVEFDSMVDAADFMIAAPGYISATLVADVCEDVFRNTGLLRIACRNFSRSEGVRALLRGEVDVVLGNISEPPEHLICKRLFSSRWAVLYADGTMDITRYLESGHVILSPGGDPFRGSLDELFNEAGQERHVRCSAPDLMSCVECVLTSGLLFTTPMFVARRLKDRFGLRCSLLPIESAELDVMMFRGPDSLVSPSQRWFLDRIIDVSAGYATIEERK